MFRSQLDARLTKFIDIQNDWDPPADAKEANADWGGTAILRALGVAGEKINKAHTDAKRQVVVVLLTDGREETSGDEKRTDPDEKLVDSGQWVTDERIQRFVKAGIPVHTFGLGGETDMRFLDKLAEVTPGGAEHLDNNMQLVEKFRELVWSLRDCWIAHVDTAQIDAGPSLEGKKKEWLFSSKPLGGYSDFGVLMYEVNRRRAQANQPRIAFAPDPPAELLWSDPAEGETERRAAERQGDQYLDRRRATRPATCQRLRLLLLRRTRQLLPAIAGSASGR